MLGVYFLLVFSGIYFMKKEIEKEADQALTMLVEQKARELNANFEGLERTLEALEGYVINNADPERLLLDQEYAQLFLDNFEHLGRDVGTVAGNAYAFYFRTEPKKYGIDMGVFVTDNGYGEYVRMQLTDLSQYDEDDREHVAWYYEPIEAGRTIWLEPYMNKNIDIYMTSYVSPVYIQGKFFGVVGLDLNMKVIQETVDSVDYLDGIGYLVTKNGDIVYSKNNPEGLKAMLLEGEEKEARNALMEKWVHSDGNGCISWEGEEQRVVSMSLRNGMILVIEVSKDEINRPVKDMINKMLVVLLVVLAVILIVVSRIQTDIIKPLRRLTEVSSHIAKGELNAQMEYHQRNEIGELSDSINSIARELREYFAHIHAQAYMDGMTGVGNKTSYLDLVRNLERKIQAGMASFAVIVFDMNGLKQINDHLGHEVGDRYIVDAAEILKKVVGAQNVYRIGGDEFMVVLENASKARVDAYFAEIDEAVKRRNEEEAYGENALAISKGAAIYDPEVDQAYKDVFKRADEAMYKNKSEYYQGKYDRRKR
jgi:diguanylate cyclase (GGDEF)-like protein